MDLIITRQNWNCFFPWKFFHMNENLFPVPTKNRKDKHLLFKNAISTQIPPIILHFFHEKTSIIFHIFPFSKYPFGIIEQTASHFLSFSLYFFNVSFLHFCSVWNHHFKRNIKFIKLFFAAENTKNSRFSTTFRGLFFFPSSSFLQ